MLSMHAFANVPQGLESQLTAVITTPCCIENVETLVTFIYSEMFNCLII